ncbi:MAG: glycosyltransferase family 4 protein [Sphingomonadales bacterium]
MKLLTFSTLYPNAKMPHHGVFVENRLRHLVRDGAVQSRVVAPIPWFPCRHSMFGQYATFAAVPQRGERHGISIQYPRFPLLPKFGMSAAPFLMFHALKPVLNRILRSGYDFDLIDAHYFYPEGVAAVMLGEALGKPVTVTARGTDLNLIPRYKIPRHLIRRAALRAAGLITVCQALKDVLVELGVRPEGVKVLRNGVDLELFRPANRAAARQRLKLTRPTLLSVGLLIARKGHDLVIRALCELPEFDLLIVGEGPEQAALIALAAKLGVSERVRFLGRVPHDQLREIYSAADIVVLASSREGWANVLLEAMACGTPVAASNVWGTPEVVASRDAGILMDERTPAALTRAVRELAHNLPDRQATRAYAEGFSWEQTTRGQLSLFNDIIGQRPGT